MDSTGCPPGYASDKGASIYFMPCQVSIPVFAIFATGAMLLRIILTFVQIIVSSFIREKEREGPNSNKSLRRKKSVLCGLQITTSFEIIHTISVLAYFPLYGLGLITESNLLGIPAIAIICLTYYGAFFFSCLKLVRLGNRVIPKGMRGVDSAYLSKVKGDGILSFLFFSYIITVIGFSVILIIVDPLYPIHTDFWLRVGFGVMSLADISGMSIVIWQTLRVSRYIKKSIKNVQELQVSGNEALKKTAKKLDFRIIGQAIALSPLTLIKICIAAGVPYSVAFSFMLVYGATLCSALATYVFIPKNFSMFTSSQKNATDTEKKSSQVSPGMDDTTTKPSQGNKVAVRNEATNEGSFSSLHQA